MVSWSVLKETGSLDLLTVGNLTFSGDIRHSIIKQRHNDWVLVIQVSCDWSIISILSSYWSILQVTFPSCWDGRLTSEDMVSDPHVVHPDPGWAAGDCPETHNKRLPTVFFEALFRYSEFLP